MKNHTIHVEGKYSISVYPKQVEITLGVVTKDSSLTRAQAMNNILLNDIRTALYKKGINQEQISTANFSIQPHTPYEKNEIEYYLVEHFLLVCTEKIHEAGLIIDTAVANGANSISNIVFTINRDEETVFYQNALSHAIIDSKEKAKVIADTVGQKLNEIPLSITEVTDTTQLQPMMLAKSYSTTITPGLLIIPAHVTVQYELLKE